MSSLSLSFFLFISSVFFFFSSLSYFILLGTIPSMMILSSISYWTALLICLMFSEASSKIFLCWESTNHSKIQYRPYFCSSSLNFFSSVSSSSTYFTTVVFFFIVCCNWSPCFSFFGESFLSSSKLKDYVPFIVFPAYFNGLLLISSYLKNRIRG